MKVTERLYLAADRKTVVKENSPKAAFLLAAKGQELPDVIARQYGLLKEQKKPQEDEVKKQVKEPENKKVSSSPNKKGKKGKEK